MKTATAITATLAAAVIALTGCSVADPEPKSAPETPVAMVAEEPAPEAETEPEAEAASALPAFGETAVSTDGATEVVVKYLGRSTASEWSTSGAVEVIEFSVAVTNKGDVPIEAYDVFFDGVYAGDTGEPFEEVYDSDNGWSGPDFATITPGRTQTVKTAFEAPEPGLVQFMMSIGFSDQIIYEGELTD